MVPIIWESNDTILESVRLVRKVVYRHFRRPRGDSCSSIVSD